MVILWDVGWFLLGMFVDLLRGCSLWIISRKHFTVFLMIDRRKQKTCFNNDSNEKALFSINSVQSNVKVIDSAHDQIILLIKEVLLMKQMPKLNNGLKAFKDLKLFS